MGRIVAYEPCPNCRKNYRDTSGDNLAVYEDGGKHCFACKHHEFPKHYIPRKEVEHVPKSLRPIDYTREVPANALKWLLQYGLPWSYWKESIGYSPKECRLVFSVRSGNSQEAPLAFSIGRYVGPADPNVRKWFVWGDCHKHAEVLGDGKCIVLVEDLISAHKLGQVTQAIPLFGTKIHPCHYYHIINENKPVVLWLDKDQELNVKRQAWQLESVINRPVKVIITEQDPKGLDFEVLRLHCNC